MRRQLVAVLKNNQKDLFSEIALRCFWSLETPVFHAPSTCPRFSPAETNDAGARVIDMTKWALQHRGIARP